MVPGRTNILCRLKDGPAHLQHLDPMINGVTKSTQQTEQGLMGRRKRRKADRSGDGTRTVAPDIFRGKDHRVYLDFYTNEEVQWAIELLRKGDRLTEHRNRFDPITGKYRVLPTKEYLVVGIRGPKGYGGAVTPKHNLCVLVVEQQASPLWYKSYWTVTQRASLIRDVNYETSTVDAGVTLKETCYYVLDLT
jgi:hypothetical protein